jgi:phosphate transport system substrate-binding protein
MKSVISFLIIYFLIIFSSALFAQESSQKKVIITGARFTYPLVEKWISEYKEANPSVEVVIESRTTTDPAKYDLLIEAYEQEKEVKESREYLYLARYALIPVANAKSVFAKVYGEKGLTDDHIRQVFFHDIYADKDDKKTIKEPFTVYTRLQKAGAPTTFAKYYGYDQLNIAGKAIAGADEHLIKALLKDSTGVSYNNPGLLYDLKTRKPLSGLTILPVDADNNGRVSNDEKFYGDLDGLLSTLENNNVKNIPVEYLHLSIRKHGYNPEALKFLLWIIDHSQEDLHDFGFLKPEQKRFDAEKEKFEQLALK